MQTDNCIQLCHLDLWPPWPKTVATLWCSYIMVLQRHQIPRSTFHSFSSYHQNRHTCTHKESLALKSFHSFDMDNNSTFDFVNYIFSDLTLLVGRQERHPGCKKLGVGLLVVTIWLELCMSCSSSCHHHIHHSGFTEANPDSPKMAVKMERERSLL